MEGCYSCIEDCLRTDESAKLTRRALFGNGWIRAETEEGDEWSPLISARCAAHNSSAMAVEAGVDRDLFFLQTVGDEEDENTGLKETVKIPKADRKAPLDLPTAYPESKDSIPAVIRVLSYNIKHGRGNDGQVDLVRTATVIRRLNPDVVALQEVDNQVQRSGSVDEARRLSELTGLRHYAFGSFFSFQGGEYGMAILSRYPLSEIQNLRLPDGAEPRTSLLATVAAPIRFRLAGVHFYRTEEERSAQATTLLKAVKGNEFPHIIAGDFNSRPDSPVLQLFSDWEIPNKGDDHFTFSSDQPRSEIDFIIARPAAAFDFLVTDVVNEPIASDHRPVVADLIISPPSTEQEAKLPAVNADQ